MAQQDDVERLAKQVIFGDVISIHTSSESSVNLKVLCGDTDSLVRALEAAGIPGRDASELLRIADQKETKTDEHARELKVQDWLKDKFKRGAAEAWGIGRQAASEIVTEALKPAIPGRLA